MDNQVCSFCNATLVFAVVRRVYCLQNERVRDKILIDYQAFPLKLLTLPIYLVVINLI